MLDKNLYNEKEKRTTENEAVEPTTNDAATDDVVYVVNDDGTQFDASERTYVAVEGLEEELESREEAEEEKTSSDE